MLVAIAALTMAAEVRIRGFIAGLGLLGVFLAPPAIGGWFLDRYLIANTPERGPPRGPARVFFERTTWFAFLLMPYLVLIPILLVAILLIFFTD